MKLIRFYDFVQLAKPQGIRVPEEIKERTKFIDSFISQKKHILATVRATHAARITANNGLYLPDRMRKGAKTMLARESGGTEPYNKPVLINHDRMADPIGRIVAADYIDITQNVQIADSYRPMLRDLANATNMWRAVDIVETLVKTGALFQEGWQGLGYIKSSGLITDPNAVEKVLDGRYLTVSTSADSNKAVCSVCHEDWVAEGEPCEHRPGKVYDNKRCFLIAGDLFYNEWSYVTAPADAEAVTEGIQLVDMEIDSGYRQVSVDKEDMNQQEVGEIYISLNDNEDTNMNTTTTREDAIKRLTDMYPHYDTESITANNLDEIVSHVDKLIDAYEKTQAVLNGSIQIDDAGVDGSSHLEVTTLIGIHNSLHYQYDYMVEHEESVEKIPAAVFALHDKLMTLAVEKGFRDELVNGKLDMIDSGGDSMESDDSKTTTTIVDQQVTILDFDTIDITADSMTEEQSEFINGLLEQEIEQMITDGVVCADGTCTIDAKLSTETRKKLPSSTFCGPNRSFPVPDCAHVTAARRLIGRYKGPGDKSRILGCVSRKAKALGCDTEDAQGAIVTTDKLTDITATVFDLSVEDQKSLYDAMTVKLADAGLVDLTLAQKVTDLTAETENNKIKISDLEDQLKWLRVELRDRASDFTHLSDRHESIIAENHRLLATTTSLIALSKEPNKNFGDLHNLQVNKTVSDLQAELQSMQDSVDFDSIVKKVSVQILDTAPTVQDPTLSDSTKQTQTTSDTISDKWIEKIVSRYQELKDSQGVPVANKYIAELKRTRFVAQTFDINKYLKG